MLLENNPSKCIEMLFNVRRDDVLQQLNDQQFESGCIFDQILIPRQHAVIKEGRRLLGELLYSWGAAD